MVTGDAEETAVCNLQKKPESSKMRRQKLFLLMMNWNSFPTKELKKKLPMLRVVSRAKPLDKKRLI